MSTTRTSSSTAAKSSALASNPPPVPTARHSAFSKSRPANQGPDSSASPDLISNLLASLPAGAQADEESALSHRTGLPITALRSSSRASRRSLVSQARRSTDSRAGDPSADFEEVIHPADTDLFAAEDDAAEEAAEAPAIRIARPPSGKSRHSKLSNATRQAGPVPAVPAVLQSRSIPQTSTYRSLGSPNNEGAGTLNLGMSRLAPASRSESATASRKDSLQSLKNEASRARENEGDLSTPRVMSAFGRYDDITALTPRSSSRASNVSAKARGASPSAARVGQTTGDTSDALNKDLEGSVEPDIAEKSISGRNSPLITRMASSRTGYYQPEQKGIEEQDEDHIIDDPEQNTETLRRIRELKAAKKERLRISGDYERNVPSPVVPTPATPPLKSSFTLFPPQSPRSQVVQQNTHIQEEESAPPDDSAPPPIINFSRIPPTASPAKKSMHSRNTSLTQKEGDRSMSLSKVQSGRLSQQEMRATSASPIKDRVDDGASSRGRPSFAGGESQRSHVDPVVQDVEDFLHAPRLSQKITIPEEQRVVSFSEVGDPEGYPVFCCVGMGMTRFVMTFYDDLAVSLRLRLITPDRPGIGDSASCRDGTGTPLRWPDDVSAICAELDIEEFSLIAHSAGAVYALATALRLPHQIRGKIHLLAPWIPPSQMSAIGLSKSQPRPTGSLPKSQRILRILPTSFLKAANSSWLSTTSSSLFGSPKPSSYVGPQDINLQQPARPSTSLGIERDYSIDGQSMQAGAPIPDGRFTFPSSRINEADKRAASLRSAAASPTPTMNPAERQKRYDARLTPIIWDLSTRRGNPAVDLIVCLERNQPIGFRYVDITRAVVIHHGNKDNRVPIENVKWLGKTMRRTEVRVLNGEGHGLMSSAGVMGSVLTELSKELDSKNLERRKNS